jgi:iron(III)-salmochelin esterase
MKSFRAPTHALRARAKATALAWLVFTAWSCRRVPERRDPPLSNQVATTQLVAARTSAEANRLSGVVAEQTSVDGAGNTTSVRIATAGSESVDLPRARPALRIALEEQTWTFQDPNFGRIDVVVVLPDRRPDERFPLLVALHGRGEAMKGSQRGARGWVDDYAMLRAMRRLGSPPLTISDFEGIVTPKRLTTLNRALEEEPYRGLVVLCPYTPDLLAGDKPFESVRPYARFLVEDLLPRARRELPVIGSAETTGIDGVSLGGRIGFLSGLFAAEHFHTVAGLQAAFDGEDAEVLGRLGDDAFRRNRGIRFRLLTSERDYFIAANQTIAAHFETRRLPMRFLLVPGPHDYIFNRGPGSIEMLFFHDRALRRAQWPE